MDRRDFLWVWLLCILLIEFGWIIYNLGRIDAVLELWQQHGF